jgi:tellurite resistance protein TehA-like permease
MVPEERPPDALTLRTMSPGWFAWVMATGILSTGTHLLGWQGPSSLLLALGTLFLAALLLAFLLRLYRYPAAVAADLAAPDRAFGFFTIVAAFDVLAARFALSGLLTLTWALGLTAGVCWLALTYGVPVAQITRWKTPSLVGDVSGANGTWFVWVVATQSLAVVATSLAPTSGASTALSVAAVSLWLVASLLYVLIAGWVLGRLLLLPVAPEELTPPYWVAMGATAISVMSGARILALPADAFVASLDLAVRMGSYALWSFGTFLFPLLLILGLWRHGLRRVPLRFEPGLWSMVFPLGMYGTASMLLGQSLHASFLAAIGSWELPLGLAAWLVVTGLLVAAVGRRQREQVAGR